MEKTMQKLLIVLFCGFISPALTGMENTPAGYQPGPGSWVYRTDVQELTTDYWILALNAIFDRDEKTFQNAIAKITDPKKREELERKKNLLIPQSMSKPMPDYLDLAIRAISEKNETAFQDALSFITDHEKRKELIHMKKQMLDRKIVSSRFAPKEGSQLRYQKRFSSYRVPDEN